MADKAVVQDSQLEEVLKEIGEAARAMREAMPPVDRWDLGGMVAKLQRSPDPSMRQHAGRVQQFRNAATMLRGIADSL